MFKARLVYAHDRLITASKHDQHASRMGHRVQGIVKPATMEKLMLTISLAERPSQCALRLFMKAVHILRVFVFSSATRSLSYDKHCTNPCCLNGSETRPSDIAFYTPWPLSNCLPSRKTDDEHLLHKRTLMVKRMQLRGQWEEQNKNTGSGV